MFYAYELPKSQRMDITMCHPRNLVHMDTENKIPAMARAESLSRHYQGKKIIHVVIHYENANVDEFTHYVVDYQVIESKEN